MTLNQLAFQFLALNQTHTSLVVAGAMAIGGLLGATVGRPKGLMARGSFFALSLLLHFSFKLLTYAMRFVLPEFGITLGLLDVLVFSLLLLLLFGYFYGQIAVARARDLYGRSTAAAIAFIPGIGWLWFILGASRDEAVADYIKLPGILKGGLAFLVGVACMVGVYFVRQEEKRQTLPFDDIVAQFEAELETKDLKDLDFEPDYGLYIRASSLEMTLESIAAAEREGIGKDDSAVLAANAEGKVLTLVLSLAGAENEQGIDYDYLNTGFIRDYCEDPLYMPIFEAGGTMTFDFRGEQDLPLAKVSIHEDACASLATQ